MLHECHMCKLVRSDVAYSIDYGGPICNACDRELYESFTRAMRQPVLTWGGWR